MEKHGLSFTESEYVYSILAAYEPYGLTLTALNRFLWQGLPDGDRLRKLTVYSVITKQEWERIFPKLVLFFDNKIVL